MMLNKIKHIPLFIFMLIGVLLWLCVYVFTPARPTETFSGVTTFYIALSFLGYFLGYFIFGKIQDRYENKQIKKATVISKNIIWVIVFIVLLSWLIRYFDLFFNRGISFYNSIQENRDLLGASKLNVIYIFGAIFKELYFFPLLLILIFYKKDKALILVGSLLFLCPLIIPFLRGTRKDVFFVFLFLGIVLVISRTILFKLKTFVVIGLVFLVLNIVFYQVLIHREAPKHTVEKNTSNVILNNARYNDLYKPTEWVKKKIESNEGVQKAVLFNMLHLAQYYCHGVFELNYLVNEKLQKKEYHDGYYTFHLIPRFLGKLNIIEIDSDKMYKPLPRKSTYITFLGSLFLDFGWFGITFMFLLGGFQKIVDEKITNGRLLFLGLYSFFIIFNVLLPVIDIIRGTGFYIVFSSMTLIIIYDLVGKSKFRKFIK